MSIKNTNQNNVECKVIDWKTVLTDIIYVMRHNLSVLLNSGTDIRTEDEFAARVFCFNGARMSGKSTGITGYMKTTNQCMLFDTVTGTSYILNNGTNNQGLLISGRNQSLQSAFEIACKQGVHTLFINSFEKDIVLKMENIFREMRRIVPAEMIIIIEN